MSQWPVGQVREDLLDLGVVTVVFFGLEQDERGVGEDSVVAPEGNSSPWPSARVRSLTRRTISRAVIALPVCERNAVYSVSATAASLTQALSWSSQIARGYWIGVQVSSGMAAIAARTCGFIATVTEKNAPLRRTAPHAAAP